MTASVKERAQSLIDYTNERLDTEYTNLTDIISNELDVDDQPTVTNIPTATVTERAQSLIDYANDICDSKHDNLTDVVLKELKGQRTYSVEEKEPYLFRKSGGSATIGTREHDKIVGGTIAWNQICPNFTQLGSTAIPFNAGTAIVAGHKYIIGFKRDINSERTTLSVYTRPNDTNAQSFRSDALIDGELTSMTVREALSSGISDGTKTAKTGNAWLYISGTSPNTTISEPQIFDLTQMFGSTVADYIYSLEQTTAGAGVAWFRNLFPKPYYEYNAGELMHVGGLQSHVMKDANNNVIGEYPLDSSLTLRGIPQLDSNNRLYFDGDEYASDGALTRKYGIVDLGTQTWSYNTNYTNPYFYVNNSDLFFSGQKTLIAKYSDVGAMGGSAFDALATDKSYSHGVSSNGSFIKIRDTSYTDATAFQTAMSGVYLVYELATPTSEVAEPYASPQIVSPYGTEEYICETQADVIVPVGHDTMYSTE